MCVARDREDARLLHMYMTLWTCYSFFCVSRLQYFKEFSESCDIFLHCGRKDFPLQSGNTLTLPSIKVEKPNTKGDKYCVPLTNPAEVRLSRQEEMSN